MIVIQSQMHPPPITMQHLWQSAKPEEEKEVCAVCLEVPGIKNISITACGHTFCTSCLLSSLRQKNTCPTCRAELEPERACIQPVSVATATELIREEERMFDMKRRLQMIHSFSGMNGRAAMIRSLCREIAFNTAHSIALWQKNSDEHTTADMYHPSWAKFDDDSYDDEQRGSESGSEDDD